MENFYVYEWYVVDTDEVIYVGKGSKLRYKCTKHNKLFAEMIKRFRCQSRIVSYYKTEEEAFYAESVRVDEMKAKGMACCNLYSGGYGGTHACVTDEMRTRMSKHNGMKSKKQRERMSINNPMKQKDVARHVGLKHAKPIIYDGVEYESGIALAKVLNMTNAGVSYAVKVGHLKGKAIKFKANQQPSVGLTTDEGSTTRR